MRPTGLDLEQAAAMKVLVAVKRVIDPDVRVRVVIDKAGAETKNVKMALNPFDEIGVETAVRLRESGAADATVAVSIGAHACQDILRTAMAMGIDRSILYETDEALEPLAVAKVLKVAVEDENPDIVILGKQAIDDDCGQTGQMLAGLLGWPQGAFASNLSLEQDRVIVVREIDGGTQTLGLPLPAVITVDLRMNEPRYASLQNIMKAKKKPLETKRLSDMAIETSPRLSTVQVNEPVPRGASCIFFDNAADLLDALDRKEGVIRCRS